MTPTAFDSTSSRRQGRLGFWLMGLVFALVLAVAVYWLIGAAKLRDGVKTWIQDQRANGLAVQLAGFEVSGFPTHWRVTFRSPGVGDPDAARPWLVEAAALKVEAALWSPETIRYQASGPYRFRLPGRPDAPIYRGASERLEGWVQLVGGRFSALRLDVVGWVSSAPDNRPWVQAKTVTLVLRPGEGAPSGEGPSVPSTLVAEVQGSDWTLPPTVGSPFGPRVQVVDLGLDLKGRVPGGPTLSALGAWRDQGGTVEITRAGLHHGPLKLDSAGTLALDGALQPIGAMTARIQGFFEAVDRLVAAGIVRDRDAVVAKMILGALAKPSANGTATLNAPLTLQDRTLSVGPIKLIKLEPVLWERVLGDHLPAIP